MKLIYIDPPFDVGADFLMDIEIGGESFTKKPNILKEIAYRDTWGQGSDSFISMIYERLILMRDLLSDDGCIYIHMGSGVGYAVEAILREVFGKGISSIISWKRVPAHGDSMRWGTVHDAIYWHTKSTSFIWNPQYDTYNKPYLKSKYNQSDSDGRRYTLGDLSSPNPRPTLTYTWRGNTPPTNG